ncbi:MAG TPA: MmcQ/YjbR family DNA-binding protein [Chitinophagaceae bacterium]|jgi:hypothetical protein|nr:MmcQ/YjbR family DNA-binding protein [Chitinophagaceae bacterium]
MQFFALVNKIMVTIATFKMLALYLPNTIELPHFEKTSFRINKKIFATLDKKANKACVKLSVTDQDIFCAFDKAVIYPIPNKWGKQGWTYIELAKVQKAMCNELLVTAYTNAIVKKETKKE